MSCLLEMEATSGRDINKIKNTRGQKNDAKEIGMCLPYDVLRIIFKYLGGMDLSSASIVCRIWLKAANDEKQRRGPVCITEDNALYASQDSLDSRNLEYNRDKIIRNLRIKPKVAIFLDRFYNQGCPSNILPLDCYSITLSFTTQDCEDSITSDSSYDTDDSLDLDNLGAAFFRKIIQSASFGEPRAFGAFLPDIPGVNIKTLYILQGIYNIEESMKKFQHSITQALTKPKRQAKTSKCVLLLSVMHEYNRMTKFVKSFNTRNSEKLCLWGGSTYDIRIHNAHHGKKGHLCGKDAFCVAIVMTGRFNCWTMIMDQTHETEAQIEKKLMELKEKVHLKRHSMGLMFAATIPAKDLNMINETTIKIFNKMFPHTPLIDCFGNAMFGSDTITDTPRSKENNYWSDSSTVFMIITYG